MVDFDKLRRAKQQPVVIDPVEIFRRRPKPEGINDLYTSQAEVLGKWFVRRDARDLVVKLHTGGGKTLVALLIAQSVLNERNEPVVYLCPNGQLVKQTLAKAEAYRVPAEPYVKKGDFSDNFHAGRSVLVCTYQALFNGQSRFGLRGGQKEIVNAGAIILDDAHVAFSAVRDAFTLRVEKKKDEEGYAELTNMFRADFDAIGRLGTFDDLVCGLEHGIADVPYWAWNARRSQVHECLRTRASNHPFQWPFLRDHLAYCHAFISRHAFVVTPFFPLVDLLPTFADCKRRIYMSATIADDSAIIRTFDAEREPLAQAISSTSLAGVSERMVLAPELMAIDKSTTRDVVEKIATWGATKRKVGTVILAPSDADAETWTSVATFPDASEKVEPAVTALQDGSSVGPVVFSNRYDGIDLPGDSCRILILAGLPRGGSEHEAYLATVLSGGATGTTSVAQRIEQGIGRGARGPNDYCVVIVTGGALVGWLGRGNNLSALTRSTRAQLEIGLEVSRSVSDRKDLADTIVKCLDRDPQWTEYHAEQLAELADETVIDATLLTQAEGERQAFRLWREGYNERVIVVLEKQATVVAKRDKPLSGWLIQWAGRVADTWGHDARAQALQQQAFATNKNLLRPRSAPVYVPLDPPGPQANAIVARLGGFRQRRAILVELDEVTSHLVAEASAAQFEQALADLGEMLGFAVDRPDHVYGKGPDVLWLLNEKQGLVLEAKSRKNKANALNKEQHGQLLNAVEWFKETYPNYEEVRASVHPNTGATASTVTRTTKVLTLEKLHALVADTRALLDELCEAGVETGLAARCDKLLANSNLTPTKLIATYLAPFK